MNKNHALSGLLVLASVFTAASSFAQSSSELDQHSGPKAIVVVVSENDGSVAAFKTDKPVNELSDAERQALGSELIASGKNKFELPKTVIQSDSELDEATSRDTWAWGNVGGGGRGRGHHYPVYNNYYYYNSWTWYNYAAPCYSNFYYYPTYSNYYYTYNWGGAYNWGGYRWYWYW
jgi:hypothetical protein